MKLRIKFKKYGPVRFIGHLDVMRYFQKTIRRAGIDVTYTAGFSPHQVMTFASPLGVGLSSDGEYMDIQVGSLPEPEEGMTACETLVKHMNDSGVRGLDVTGARILPENAGNAMASVAAASYTVRFREGRKPEGWDGNTAEHLIRDFLVKKEVMAQKQTKNGVRTVDLRPGVYRLSWQDGGFFMLVDASSAGNIKPALLIGALLAGGGMTLAENALSITRKDVYTAVSGENGAVEFVSLGEIGFEEPCSLRGEEAAP